MTPSDIDVVYTRLCKSMTDAGEKSASLFLARFALLAIVQIGDRDVACELVEAAARDIDAAS